MAVGSRIRRLRLAAQMTQRAVSERAGVATSYLSRLENGLIMPSITTLEKLARALDVSMGAFFDAEDEGEGSDDCCPVSIDGECIRNHPIIARGRRPAQQESYTPQQLKTLAKCNYVLQRGDIEAITALTTLMDGLVALLQARDEQA